MTLTDKYTLRPYQLEAVRQLATKPNVLCADEMGLGKTPTAIVLDDVRRNMYKNKRPGKPVPATLVVCPLSGVVDSWVRHFSEWTDLSVKRINPKKRDEFLDDEHQVFVMHWEAVQLMQPELAAKPWLHIIADEVHRIKNRKTKTAKAMKGRGKNYDKWNVLFKTGLSGTPMPNRPDELWSILNWLYYSEDERKPYFSTYERKLLRSYWRFYERYVRYIELPPQMYHKVLGPKNTDELKDLLDSCGYVRRLKKDVLTELPPKQYTTYEVELDGKQRRAYEGMKKTLIAWVGKNENKPVVSPVVISQLIRLQQFAVAYGDVVTVKEGDPDRGIPPETKVVLSEPSAKLDVLMSIAEDLGDKQLVVFSQFSQAVDLAKARFEKAGYTTVKLTGAVPHEQRTENIKTFMLGDAQVFLATIGAGGTGIDLYCADTVVFIDRDWSPAENQQAEDRLHRMGQQNAVNVIDLVAKDTVDQGKQQKLDLKWSWIKEIIGA